jgi:hypothetical protein
LIDAPAHVLRHPVVSNLVVNLPILYSSRNYRTRAKYFGLVPAPPRLTPIGSRTVDAVFNGSLPPDLFGPFPFLDGPVADSLITQDSTGPYFEYFQSFFPPSCDADFIEDNFEIRKVTADHNCLFHCISLAQGIYGFDRVTQFRARQLLVARMRGSIGMPYSSAGVGADTVLSELASEARVDWLSLESGKYVYQSQILAANRKPPVPVAHCLGEEISFNDRFAIVFGIPDDEFLEPRVHYWLNWLLTPQVWGTLQMVTFIPMAFQFSVVVYVLDTSVPNAPRFVRSLILIKSVTSPLLVLLRTTLPSGVDHWELVTLLHRDMVTFLATTI